MEYEGVGPRVAESAYVAPKRRALRRRWSEWRAATRRASAGTGPSRPANIGAVTLIAHAGHWLTTIAYFVPVVVFLGWLVVTQVRDRRSRSGP